ncbi:hypothetical protein AKO1_013905, partial [Acrasis kona]
MSVKNWLDTVSVMIDDGAAEVKAMGILKVFYVICAFHLRKSWNEWLDKNSPKEDIAGVLGLLLAMRSSTTDEEYMELYKTLKEKYKWFCEQYFDQTWHVPRKDCEEPFFRHWTSIGRRCNYGLCWVNNFIEAVYKNWTYLLQGNKNQRYDETFDFAVNLMKGNMYKERFTVSRKSSTEWDLEKRKKSGFALVDGGESKFALVDWENLFFDVYSESRKVMERLSLRKVGRPCPCNYCLFKGKICKKIFACYIYILRRTNCAIPLTEKTSDPSDILTAATLFIHGNNDAVGSSSTYIIPYGTTNPEYKEKVFAVAHKPGAPRKKATKRPRKIGSARTVEPINPNSNSIEDETDEAVVEENEGSDHHDEDNTFGGADWGDVDNTGDHIEDAQDESNGGERCDVDQVPTEIDSTEPKPVVSNTSIRKLKAKKSKSTVVEHIGT